jgi:hypothetical protein
VIASTTPGAPRLRWALLVSAGLGLLDGALRYPQWQDVIEPGQVLAHLVSYPADAPVYVYSMDVRTVLHQLVALALWAGIPEQVLTVAATSAMGALSYTALSAVCLACGGHRVLAALLPAVMMHAGVTALPLPYPALIIASPTYGIVGHMGLLLAAASIAVGRDRTAGVIVGVFPCVHPGMALWTWTLVALLTVIGGAAARRRLLDAVPAVLCGLAVAMVSLLHLQFLHPVHGSAGDTMDLAHAARANWDPHRRPIDWLQTGPLVAALVSVLAVIAGPVRGVGSCTSAALVPLLLPGFVLAAALLPRVPLELVQVAMPQRLLSLVILAAAPVLCGLGTRPTMPAAARVSAWIWAAAVAAREARGELTPSTAGAALVLLAVSLALAARWPRAWWPVPPRLTGLLLTGAQGTVMALVTLTTLTTARQPEPMMSMLAPPARAIATLAEREGLLLTAGSMHLIQAQTRRPILLDGDALSGLTYAPEPAVTTERILNAIYGLSLRLPTTSATGEMPADAARTLWESRSSAEWLTLAESFQFTDILTPSDWQLQVPLVVRDDAHAVWTVVRGPA